MSTLTSYNGLQIATRAPTGYGGNAVNNNFKALATRIDTVDPTTGADSTQGFSAGSRWFNSATSSEWVCLSADIGAASWAMVTGVQYNFGVAGTSSGSNPGGAAGEAAMPRSIFNPGNGGNADTGAAGNVGGSIGCDFEIYGGNAGISNEPGLAGEPYFYIKYLLDRLRKSVIIGHNRSSNPSGELKRGWVGTIGQGSSGDRSRARSHRPMPDVRRTPPRAHFIFAAACAYRLARRCR